MDSVQRKIANEFLGGAVTRIFDLLEICGEEAEQLGNVPSELWMLLSPGDAFRKCDARVYRSHVRELILRHHAKEDLSVATNAELLLGLQAVSMKTPLKHEGVALYHHMFFEVFGREVYEELHGNWMKMPDSAPGTDEASRGMIKTGRPRHVS